MPDSASYFVVPDSKVKGGGKAYRLLADAMRRSGHEPQHSSGRMSRSTATRVAGGTATRRASRPTHFGQKDTQLGAEMPYEEAVIVGRAYKRKLIELGLARFYGVRIERRPYGQAVVKLGRHDDKPMPVRWVS